MSVTRTTQEWASLLNNYLFEHVPEYHTVTYGAQTKVLIHNLSDDIQVTFKSRRA